MKSFTEHFIRVWIHTSKISKVSRNISYVYEFIRRRFHTRIKSNAFEKIRVCKIPWMILHNDTRIKSYTYEKLHVWTVTRMKNYTYEKLHVLNIAFWLVHCYTRIDSFTELLIRVCFLTWNFSYVEPLALFVDFGQPYNPAQCWLLMTSICSFVTPLDTSYDYVDDENKFEWIIFKMSPGFNELRDLSGKALYVQILLILTEGNFIESIMDISIWNLNM